MPATSPDDLFPDALDALQALLADPGGVDTAWRVLGLFSRDPPPAALAPLLAPTLAILEAAIAGEDPVARGWASYAILDWETRFPAPEAP
jgi:hypothetical protein